MRLFAALELPVSIARDLARLDIAPSRGVRRVEPEQMHITLHFIGDADTGVVTQALQSVDCEAFRVSLGGVGRFAIDGGRAILWADVRDTPQLQALHGACAAALAGAGIRLESRRWRPHVTLARLSASVREAVTREFLRAGRGREFGAFIAERFVLYNSATADDGVRYEVQASYALRRPA